jgi:hypothetical protein
MDIELTKIQKILSIYIEDLAKELIEILGSKSVGKIRYGVGCERENSIVGNISYTPYGDPEEESIEALLKIIVRGKTLTINTDICWSDGEIIKEINPETLTYRKISDVSQKLKIAWEIISPQIREKMISLINLNLSPRYRKD